MIQLCMNSAILCQGAWAWYLMDFNHYPLACILHDHGFTGTTMELELPLTLSAISRLIHLSILIHVVINHSRDLNYIGWCIRVFSIKYSYTRKYVPIHHLKFESHSNEKLYTDIWRWLWKIEIYRFIIWNMDSVIEKMKMVIKLQYIFIKRWFWFTFSYYRNCQLWRCFSDLHMIFNIDFCGGSFILIFQCKSLKICTYNLFSLISCERIDVKKQKFSSLNFQIQISISPQTFIGHPIYLYI